jgi:cytochrome c553
MMRGIVKTPASNPRRLLAALALLTACTTAPAAPAFEDSMAQRTLACTACHGEQGRAGPDGYYPRLAGKPAGYLYHQLLNFREGRRHYGLMTRMVDPLSDAYLLEIARHFASLDLPYPPPSTQQPPVAPALLQRGQTLAQHGDAERRIPACVQCHGTRLTGVAPSTPGLLGLPLDYLNAQLGAWKTGQRRAHAPDCMAQIVERLRPEDVVAVASWLARQPLPADIHPATAAPPPVAGAERLTCGSAPAPQGVRP